MDTDIKVLLVEDSLSDAQLVEAVVSSSNLGRPQMFHARRFGEALIMLAQQRYDLVLLDLHLPDGEGLDLIRQLKQRVPETPVVVLTGLQDETVAVAAILEGAQDYVTKSDTFSPTRLSQLGPTDAGNLLVRRIQYAIKRAELTKSLEAEQARYALANRGTDEGIWDWDLKTDRIYFASRWQSLLGIDGNPTSSSLSEWVSQIHPHDRDRFERTLQDYFDQHQQQFYCEYRIQHADGHYIWVLTRGKALWDQFNIAYRMVGSQSDITARKHEEAAAYQRKELVLTVLQTVGAGLLSMQAMLHVYEDRYEEAEPLLKGTLEMRKALLGHEHLDVAASLYNLASLYDNQFRFQEAETLFKQSLAIFQKALGAEHPHAQHVNVKVAMICRLNQTIGLFSDYGDEGVNSEE
ncbi:MAG: response regulator [Cyanobacteria bacterium P01_D01_bin.1]